MNENEIMDPVKLPDPLDELVAEVSAVTRIREELKSKLKSEAAQRRLRAMTNGNGI
jgi:hypothetical protein